MFYWESINLKVKPKHTHKAFNIKEIKIYNFLITERQTPSDRCEKSRRFENVKHVSVAQEEYEAEKGEKGDNNQ